MKIYQKQQWLLIGSLLGILLLMACSTAGNESINENDEAVAPGEEVEEALAATAVPATESSSVPETEEVTVTVTAVPATLAPEAASNSAEGIMTTDDRSDRLRTLTASWQTNWQLHTIGYDEILSGGPPRDGIPSVDEPQFISVDEARSWLEDNEPVIAVDLNGVARAYPLQILTWHEIVNDHIGETPIIVTFCPLCNSALVFERRLNGETFEFGTSGLLRNSDLIMYDRTTESLWQQFTGEAIVGDMAGQQLTFLPSALVSFADFAAAYPAGEVLSKETGLGPSYAQRYGKNPYVGYDTVGSNPFLFDGELDGRLQAVERVVTLSFDELDIAYPLRLLSQISIINDSPGGHDLVVFHSEGTASALNAEIISLGKDVGATGVFVPFVEGQKLTFIKEGDEIVDEQTGSAWNILGQATAGSLAGSQLTPIVHGDHFWFSWAAFKPDTIIYGLE